MMNFLKKILDPRESQLRELDLDMVLKVLESETVRRRWADKVVDLVRNINQELDRLLEKQDRSQKWEAFAIERRTLLRTLSLVLDANDELESEKAAEEARTRLYSQFQGASAPLDARPNSGG